MENTEPVTTFTENCIKCDKSLRLDNGKLAGGIMSTVSIGNEMIFSTTCWECSMPTKSGTTKYTDSSIRQYIGKSVNIKTDYANFYNERAIGIEGNSLVTEYHHSLKTPEDGLLREHWIKISSIESIQTA